MYNKQCKNTVNVKPTQSRTRLYVIHGKVFTATHLRLKSNANYNHT